MAKYKIAIFDLDGTLSDSKEGITKSAQYALGEMGIVVEDLDSLEKFIGPPLVDSFRNFYGMSLDDAKKATAIYRERYTPIGLYETRIYPGSKEMLDNLRSKGIKIALGTSKPTEMAEEVLKHLGIYEYFDYIMGAELTGPRQSKADVLNALFELMEVTDEDKSEAVMIGDTIFDVEGADKVGIHAIGVEYGYGDRGEMLKRGAVIVVKDTTELTNYLLD